MKNRSLPLTQVAAAALVALTLVLGTVASADAAGLTKKAVKKIAAKVVKKQAKTLRVAHATTADTATSASRVGGFTAGQLRTTAYRYSLPTEPTGFNRIYTFPGLPSGNYLVTYSYGATTSENGTQIGCNFFTDEGSRAHTNSDAFSTSARASAADSIVVDAETSLDCGSSPGTFTINTGLVTFVPIDTVVQGSAASTAP